MQQQPVALIGIYNANGGFRGEISYFFGHLVGAVKCELCDITHSPLRRKAAFDSLAVELKEQYGLDFALKHKNELSESETQAATGQMPCVLAQFPDGSLGMLLDRVDLRALDGSVSKFGQLLKARLALFF